MRSPCGIEHVEGDCVAHVDAGWREHVRTKQDAHYAAYYQDWYSRMQAQKFAAVEAGEEDWCIDWV